MGLRGAASVQRDHRLGEKSRLPLSWGEGGFSIRVTAVPVAILA